MRTKRSTTREEIQQEFQKLDVAVKKLAAKRAIEASNDRRPTAAYGQVATLKHEAEEETTGRSVTSSAQQARQQQMSSHVS